MIEELAAYLIDVDLDSEDDIYKLFEEKTDIKFNDFEKIVEILAPLIRAEFDTETQRPIVGFADQDGNFFIEAADYYK